LATLFVGTYSAFWILILISIIILLLAPFLTRRLRNFICLALAFIMIVISVFGRLTEPLQTISTEVEIFFFTNNVIILTIVVASVIISYDLAVARAEEALQLEFSRAEALLLNILPAEIAARLKAQEEPLADTHESVSVLFADLAGFTNISRKMSADELVNLLNDLFSRFDKLAEERGAEKIKTIGDAYMVATGLKGSVADHAENIADLALGMQKAFGEFRRDNNVDLKLRIGVHSGAVIAGVIGKQKFSYDLWGDTVNVASRMESEGIPDQIQISAETWELLSNRYQTSSRGEIEIKGHRPRMTYMLEGHA
jgi:class 3 adenylate cyclase